MTLPSQPRYPITLDKAVMIPMHDGTQLAADIYRPDVNGRFPAIVERTPYNREESVILRTKTPQYLAERGFVVVVQDVRGRFGSEGTWYPFVDDGWGDNKDGYDTIEWIAQQPWCSGKVGTAGGSYAGQTQMFLAPTRPDGLACCFVREAASDLAEQWCYRGGAMEWAFNLDWTLRHGVNQLRRQIDLLQKTVTTDSQRFLYMPQESGSLTANPFRWFHDTLAHRDDKDFWEQFNFETQYNRIDTPIYHMAGWFDIFLEGSLRNFAGVAKEGHSKKTRRSQKLIVGPWTHGPMIHDPAFARYVGDLDFGEEAVVDFNALMLRWYDHWLNDIDTGLMDEPPVRYFLMGANEWRTADTWPPPPSRRERLYLHAGKSGSADSLIDGGLSQEKPADKRKPDRYRYDPADPVPTVGGNTLYSALKKMESGEEAPDFSLTAGPRDQRSVEPRCLTYTSAPLPADLEVVGLVTLTLYASSSCVDTDFTAKLCDVYEDGRSILVTDGLLRARYRKGRWQPRRLKRGKVYPFKIELGSTAWRFAAGHRLRVSISSSNFPRFDRNLNTGAGPLNGVEMKIADNVVYGDGRYPSHLTLPIL